MDIKDYLILTKANDVEINNLMKEELKSIENVKAMNGLRTKALYLFKKDEISLDRMESFFHTGMFQEKKKTNCTDDETKKILNASCLMSKDFNNESQENILFSALNTFAGSTVPEGLLLNCSETGVGVYTSKEVKKDAVFGPYIGVSISDRQNAYDNGFCWEIFINNHFHHCVDARNANESNWMRYVNPTSSSDLQNFEAFQNDYQIYFRAIRDIPAGTELLVWYSLQYNQDCNHTVSNIDSNQIESLQDIVSNLENINTTSSEDKLSLKCDLCDVILLKKTHLIQHQRQHKREKHFKCEFCTKIFSHPNSLRHHRRFHIVEKPNCCSFCQKSFANINELIDHERIHTGEKPFKCSICASSFATISNLRAHSRIHANDKSYGCSYGARTFAFKTELNRHIHTHTGEKPFKCDICQRAFADKSTRNVHLRTHSGETTKCQICGRKYTCALTHICSHSSDMPTHQCDICQKIFTAAASLRNHQRIHTGEKPFKCDFCHRAFTKKNDLKRHRSLHTGEKAYKCEVCQADFRLKAQLNKHIDEHNDKEATSS